jgi:hypothetical protein
MPIEPSVEKLSILTPNELSFRLGICRDKLGELAKSADSLYSPFATNPKPKPFAKAPAELKVRLIDNPVDDLKFAQRKICKLLNAILMPSNMCGSVPRRSLLDNIGFHLRCRTLVTLDIKSFFPSISEEQVFGLWHHFLGCSKQVSKLLTALSTFKGYLPQGSPCSPLLSNILIWSIDAPIRRAARIASVSYSTWIDDLAFSGERARDLIDPTVAVLTVHGFRISRKKIKIMGVNDKKVLNGNILGNRSPRVTDKRIGLVRAAIHNLAEGRVPEGERAHYVASVVGKIRHIEFLNARQAAPLNRKLNAALVTYR